MVGASGGGAVLNDGLGGASCRTFRRPAAIRKSLRRFLVVNESSLDDTFPSFGHFPGYESVRRRSNDTR